jgi:hypothetical protein
MSIGEVNKLNLLNRIMIEENTKSGAQQQEPPTKVKL